MAFYFPVRLGGVHSPMYTHYRPQRSCNRSVNRYHPFWCDFEDNYLEPYNRYFHSYPMRWQVAGDKPDVCCNTSKRKISSPEPCLNKLPRNDTSKQNENKEKSHQSTCSVSPDQLNIPIHRMKKNQPEKWSKTLNLAGIDPDNIKITVKENKTILIEGYQEIPVFSWPTFVQAVKINKELVPPENADVDKLRALFGEDETLTLEAPFFAENDAENVPKDDKNTAHAEEYDENVPKDDKNTETVEVPKENPENAEGKESTEEISTKDKDKHSSTDESFGLETEESMKITEEKVESSDCPLEDLKLLFEQESKTDEENEADKKSVKPHGTSAPHSIELPLKEVKNTQEITEDNFDDDKFHLSFDMKGFEPADIQVKVVGDLLSLTAKHEDVKDGIISRQEIRKTFSLPESVKKQNLQCKFNEAGRLTIY